MSATLRELAQRFGCELVGDPDRVVERVATLAAATEDTVSFLANPLYRSKLPETRAGAVILEPRFRDECPVACLVHERPYAAYARIAAYLHPAPAAVRGVHASAVVAADAEVDAGAEIGPQAVIGPRCRVAAGAVIGPGSVLAGGVTIGSQTRLAPRVTVLEGVQIGARCIVHSGAVIGADGFGFAPEDGAWVKIPQVGSVVIGDDVEIGANTTIDRGAIDDTVLEDGVKLDNLVQIAHNVRIGAHTVMAAMSGAAGSTRIGRRCMIGGRAVMINHLDICDDVMVTFSSVVTRSIDKPGVYSGVLPAEEASVWRRNAVRFRRLESLAERLLAVERALAKKKGEER